jgi:hypothetical protein
MILLGLLMGLREVGLLDLLMERRWRNDGRGLMEDG